MKQVINLAAYGWRHRHWSGTFYPEDLHVEGADDWRLAYYSNEFNAVLVPADYWQLESITDCENWLDDVHADFQFFAECHPGMFTTVSLVDLKVALTILKPQLSGLVILDADQQLSDLLKKQVIKLADSLGVQIFGAGRGSLIQSNVQKIWRPDESSDRPRERLRCKALQLSALAFIEDELTDLRVARTYVEQYAAYLSEPKASAMAATIIVSHPQLQAGNLSKFRSVLDLMGY